MPASPIVHIELAAKDPAASSKFYADVFGWKIEVDPNFNYHQFSAEGGPPGGFNQIGENFKAGEVIPYLATDDIEGTLKKVERAGGKISHPKEEIPGVGWFALFFDPAGNRIGLFSRK